MGVAKQAKTTPCHKHNEGGTAVGALCQESTLEDGPVGGVRR